MMHSPHLKDPWKRFFTNCRWLTGISSLVLSLVATSQQVQNYCSNPKSQISRTQVNSFTVVIQFIGYWYTNMSGYLLYSFLNLFAC